MSGKEAEGRRRKKILVILPSFRVGSGVTTHVLGYYKKLRNTIDFDFITYAPIDDDKIKKTLSGSKVYVFNKSIFGERKRIKNFFSKQANEYDIIHCHTFNYGLPYLYYAKKYHVPNRIIHIHSIKYSDNLIKASMNRILLSFCMKNANHYFACSEKAGQKAFGHKEYFVAHNAFDLSKYSTKNRHKTRKELGIDSDTFVFGNVGRMVKTKNQLFAVRVFEELKKTEKFKSGKLIIIGDGLLREQLLGCISKSKFKNDIIVLDPVNNVEDYYAAMDCFIFPSLYEGLGLVLVEAQASGLPCFCFDCLPEEAFSSEIIHRIGSDENAATWTSVIISADLTRKNVRTDLINAGFDINNESKKLADYYELLIKDEKKCA